LILGRWPGTDAKLLQALGLASNGHSKIVHISDTLQYPASSTSIAISENCTLVLNRLLPYDLNYEPPFSTELDQRLKQISIVAPILAFFIDGMSLTYGLCVFAEGKVVRARKTISGRTVSNYGIPYPEEVNAVDMQEDEEARILALSARWLGAPLDTLFFVPSFFMNVYET